VGKAAEDPPAITLPAAKLDEYVGTYSLTSGERSHRLAPHPLGGLIHYRPESSR
jgi:hypothetical protein